MNDVNVIIVDRGRKNLYLRYTDPITGQKVEKSARTSNKREAVKQAGKWQSELEKGQSTLNNRLQWDAFQDAYLEFVQSRLAEGTARKVYSLFNIIDEMMKPDNVGRIQPQWITKFQLKLLKLGRQPSTIESHCRHLKAALNWAADQGLIAAAPKFPVMKRARKAKFMKGRCITGEEFDRMLEAVKDHLPAEQQASMKMLLIGLWLSGLRLGEALGLTWDQWAEGIRVDMSGEYVKLLIPGEAEKGGKDRTYAVTPDFAKFLQSVPVENRVGSVFNPLTRRLKVSRRTYVVSVSKMIGNIGRWSGVKVDQKGDRAFYASAHDLRRAFGKRWSRTVPAMVLKELMRHESVTTTEKYYVDIDADATAAMLARLLNSRGDTLGDTSVECSTAHEKTPLKRWG